MDGELTGPITRVDPHWPAGCRVDWFLAVQALRLRRFAHLDDAGRAEREPGERQGADYPCGFVAAGSAAAGLDRDDGRFGMGDGLHG